MKGINILNVALSLTLSAAQEYSDYNYFVIPPESGDIHDYTDNPKFSWGSQQLLQWRSDWDDINIKIYQNDNEEFYILTPDDFHGSGAQTFPYNATYPTYILDVDLPKIFFFRVNNVANDSETFSSHYFNLTDIPSSVTASSQPTIPSATTSPKQPTRSTDVPADPTLSSTQPPMQGQSSPSSSLSAGASAGIGVGVAAGVFAISVAVGFWLYRHRQARKYREEPTRGGVKEQRFSWTGEQGSAAKIRPPDYCEPAEMYGSPMCRPHEIG